GVTDYCGIQCYRAVKAKKAEGRLKEVHLLFPNVEFRLGIETAKHKPINIHLIFSPDDPEHETHIERILARLSFDFNGSSYHCTSADLIRLGKAFEPTTKDNGAALRLGVTQFKTSLRDLHN